MYLFRIIVAFTVTLAPGLLEAQIRYSDNRTLSQKAEAFAREYPAICSVKSIVKTTGGKDIWLITIGKGDRDNKPGIAVLGGVDGRYIIGRELAAGFAGNLLKNSSSPEINALLDKITFYIFPDVSPDASGQFFAEIKYERSVNEGGTDDDRDFMTGEDPYEDLNKDGFITSVRIKDPAGNYIESEEDNRIMIPADLSKGQKGNYLVYSEGIDNDKDGRYNEDGEGGVNFNSNFTFNYEEFGKNAGLYPISEPETRAVAEFLFDRFNIFATFSFGPEDNLGQPLRSSERPSAGRKITSIMKTDETINKLVSDRYHDITGAKGAPVTTSSPGNFMDWSYYHYGRYSFSTPGWWFAAEKGKNQEAAFLTFAGKNKIDDVFVPWAAITHPDFPGKSAEVGGIKPFVMINPPADTIGDLIDSHYRFITEVAAMHPELEFIDIKNEDLGSGIFRLTLKVHNKGVLATSTEIGDRNIWTRIMRIRIEPAKSQSVVSGAAVQRINRLQGNETAEFSWLISGKGIVKITAGAVNTGTISSLTELK